MSLPSLLHRFVVIREASRKIWRLHINFCIKNPEAGWSGGLEKRSKQKIRIFFEKGHWVFLKHIIPMYIILYFWARFSSVVSDSVATTIGVVVIQEGRRAGGFCFIPLPFSVCPDFSECVLVVIKVAMIKRGISSVFSGICIY